LPGAPACLNRFAAGPISRVTGVPGASVIARVMGMLLAALAVSMVLSAIGEWLNPPKP
jgi:multiple antibiotic resistance protein